MKQYIPKSVLTLLAICICSIAIGQKLRLDYAVIPDSLKKNADAIIRKYVEEVEVLTVDKMSHKVSKSITVLNEKGDYEAHFAMGYDKLSKVVSLSGRIYNSSGVLDKTLKMSDFYDTSYYSDLELFSDNRVKVYSPNIKDYPYTVEYEYEIVFNGVIHIETWFPVYGQGVAVEEAILKFTTPSNLEFKLKTGNYPVEYSKETNKKNFDVHRWSLKNYKAIKWERYMPGSYSLYPYVLLSPVKFEYDGTSGDLSSWNSLGLWCLGLLKDRMTLSEPTVLKIRELTDGLSSDREKVKAVYQYMQNRTRYINISLGIGGFQPMQASDVDKYGYGDCKALSNYTRTLLAAIGIPSYYTVIGAGSSKIRFPDFATLNQANHVILTVPLENDTIWLECTNPHSPFGYVGESIANRKALLIDNEGGKLIDMPHYSAADNLLVTKMQMNIIPNGNANGQLSMIANGLRFGDIGYYKVASDKKLKDYLLKTLPINNLQIESFEVQTEGDEDAIATLNVKFSAGKYSNISGNRMFVPLNKIDKSYVSFSSKKERISDVYIPSATTNEDKFEFVIPEGYEIDFLPKNESLDSPYGNYCFTCEREDGKIIYTRKLVIYSGVTTKEDYPGLNDFFDKVVKLDNAKMVLKKI